MQSNADIIRRFYTAFQQLDHTAMNACYSTDIVFNDPAFGLLQGDEVRAMWRMLCTRAGNFRLEFSDIELLDEEYATCSWTATYTFSATGRNVVNRIKAFMKLKDGLIIEHSDAFSLSKWSAQAFGWKGQLFGWMGWFRRAVQQKARKNLKDFIDRNYLVAGSR